MRFGLGIPSAAIVRGGSATDATAPALLSVTVGLSGTFITFAYSENLDPASVPAAGDGSLGGAPTASIASVSILNNTMVWNLTGYITAAQNPTTTYTPGTNKVKDLAGNLAAAIVARAVDSNLSTYGAAEFGVSTGALSTASL